MTTAELIDLLRTKLDDRVPPHQFEETDVLGALNHAQNEFARVTLCVFDGTTSVTAAGGTPWVTLPEGTVWVTAAQFGTTNLRVVTQQELEYGYFSLNGTEANTRFSDWRTQSGTPKFFVRDLSALTGRLVPYPTSGATLTLERYCLPSALTSSTDPQIPAAYHENLLAGAAAFLFGIPDTETMNQAREQVEMGKWMSYLQQATIHLQTELRAPGRVIPMPQGNYFKPPVVNTIGPNQNDNTES